MKNKGKRKRFRWVKDKKGKFVLLDKKKNKRVKSTN